MTFQTYQRKFCEQVCSWGRIQLEYAAFLSLQILGHLYWQENQVQIKNT